MTVYYFYRNFIRLGLFYIVSLCLLLSWGEELPAVRDLNISNSSDNLTVVESNDRNSVSDKSTGDSGIEHSVVQSSFEEVVANNGQVFSQSDTAFTEMASQNSGLPNIITDTGQGILFTLTDTATAELQQKADIPSAITSHNETPNLTAYNASTLQTLVQTEVEVQNSTTAFLSNESSELADQETEKIELDTLTVELKENITENNEDIPSFSEWAQKKQLEEAEKKKELVNTSSQANNLNGKSGGSGKVRSKNYASLDCGAKIVAANPEAVSSSSILSPSRDEYMLNACTNRIWFIVELCEAIQAKKIDLANFELFSSLPKEFSIYVSDRHPSRDWLNVGHFTAKDERDVQTFDLHPQLFGKFVKFEMHSHYGSEHFCPISLFRVYGTSEFEVLEKENQAHTPLEDDDDDDEPLDSDNGQEPKNLFSSATDVVISMVKKAAEVLGNKGNNSNHTNDAKIESESIKLESQCKTPSHIVVCDNCSDVLYDNVYELLSCQSRLLYNLLTCDMINKTLFNTDTCAEYGLHFRSKRTSVSKLYNEYIRSFFPKTYQAALCNVAAVIDNKVVLNISKQFPNITNQIPNELDITITMEQNTASTNKTDEVKATEELTIDKIQLETSIPNELNISNTSQIKPTKTLTPDNNLNTHITAENKDDIKTVQPTEYLEETHENTTQTNADSAELDENISDFEVVTESPEDLDLINEFNNLGSLSGSTNAPPTQHTVPQVKETVILRLSNRIKALERNMSLSSQYLEELSRRYKRQVEEIQKLLDKTVVTLTDEGKKHDDRIKKLEHQISELTLAVQMLVDEKNSWMTITYWLFLVVVVACCVFTFCGKKESKQCGVDRKSIQVHRRKSIDVVNHNVPPKKIRRPSEEALKITGTYQDLMKDDVELKKRLRERKRKRKKGTISRSNSIGMLAEEATDQDSEKTVTSDTGLQFRPSYTSSKIWNRQESSPSTFPDWEGNRIKSQIEDIPFVLEESDNSPLESLPAKPLQTEVKINGNVSQKIKHMPSFLKTANEARSKRKNSTNGSKTNNKKDKNNHRKSSSFDETRQGSPAPSLGTGSLNISYDEVKKHSSPKKDRKGAIKRILKKVFPSDI